MRLRIAKIEAAAADRPPGYVEAVISRGQVDGEWLEISSEALAELRAQFRPAMPSVGTMISSAASAAMSEAQAILRRVPALPEPEIERRMGICSAPCGNYDPAAGRCQLCGCYLKLKTALRTGACPAGKW